MKALRPNIVKRLRAMLDERGIPHQTMDNTDDEVAAIVAYITDECGGVTEHIMDAESLICEQDWMDLPILMWRDKP